MPVYIDTAKCTFSVGPPSRTLGLIAGWLAGQVMKGGGYSTVVDIILGILRGRLGRLDLRDAGNLARRRHNRLHHCGICRCGDFDC